MSRLNKMIEMDVYEQEPVGHPQEVFGADVVESCTHTALDHFFDTKNAWMWPLLNAAGMAMLYTEDAELIAILPGEPPVSCHGRAAIEGFYERLAETITAVTTIESERSVVGRSATWFGKVKGVGTRSRNRLELDAVFKVEFDEFDRVTRQWCKFELLNQN